MTEEDIFHEALALHGPAERAAYLDRACAGDPGLRASLEELLQAAGGASEFLTRPPLAADETAGDGLTSGVLGDFRIVREVGRGGMGVVYEAEQISLRRRVALKVLPFAATMDPRQLQRFKNEAVAAASLHHEHIVPVYFVGCERAVHFIAMQFVEGTTLAQLINDLYRAPARPTDPTGDFVPGGDSAVTAAAAGLSTEVGQRGAGFYRGAARLVAQAADALEHAHALGVVHRDVKPANLMVDSAGKLWVADFGLARVGGGDAGLTMSGDLLGTLRYMSPEQALARHGLVDHRTDVYALGAVLYELLTGKPVVTGDDKQAVLRQLAFEEPVPPRKLDPALPRDLETIVLKCLEKEPDHRYAAAKELADDLRRWLGHEPVRAKPPTLTMRAGKWARRNRGVVWSAATGLLLAAAMLGGSVAWAVRDAAARRERTEPLVEQAVTEAERHAAADRWPQALEAARRADGLLAGAEVRAELRHRAADALRAAELVLAIEDADLMLVVGSKDPFRNYGATTSPLWDFETRREGYSSAFRRQDVDPEVMSPDDTAARIPAAARVRAAVALRRWSAGMEGPRQDRLLATARTLDPDSWRTRISDALGRKDVGAVREMVAEDRLAECSPMDLAWVGFLLADVDEFETAAKLFAWGVAKFPGEFWLNFGFTHCHCHLPSQPWEKILVTMNICRALRPEGARLHLDLAWALAQLKRYDESIALYRRGLQAVPDSPAAHTGFGRVLYESGNMEEAEVHFRMAIRLDPRFVLPLINLGQILKDRHKEPAKVVAPLREAIGLKPGQAHRNHALGLAFNELGLQKEAEASFREAIRLDPNNAHHHNGLGSVLRDFGDIEAAVVCFREALRLDANYSNPRRNLGLILRAKDRNSAEGLALLREAARLDPRPAVCQNDIGCALGSRGDYEGAILFIRESIRLRPSFALAHANLGITLSQVGRPDDAIVSLRRAIELDAQNPQAHHWLGNLLTQRGAYADARAAFEQLLKLTPGTPNDHNNLAWLLATCPDATIRDSTRALTLARRAVELAPKVGTYWNTLGVAQYRAGDWKAAVSALDKSMGLRRGGDAFDWYFLAMAHWQLGEKDKARDWYDKAVQWNEKNAPNDMELARFRAEAAGLLGRPVLPAASTPAGLAPRLAAALSAVR